MIVSLAHIHIYFYDECMLISRAIDCLIRPRPNTNQMINSKDTIRHGIKYWDSSQKCLYSKAVVFPLKEMKCISNLMIRRIISSRYLPEYSRRKTRNRSLPVYEQI